MTQPNIARVYSIMQELQQLRDKTRKLLDKNIELAKALTATKEELTKARAAQRAVFSDKVLEWMGARHNPVKVQHQAVQCTFEEHGSTYTSEENEQLEPDPPLSPCHSHGMMQALSSCSSSAVEPITYEADPATDAPDQFTEDDNNVAESEDKDDGSILERVSDSRTSAEQDVDTACLDNHDKQRQCTLPSSVELEQTSLEAGVMKRLRQRDANVSYVEPKLNTKLRRGDYYGLGKRASQPKNTRHMTKHRLVSGPRRASAAFVPARCGQQYSPFRRHRAGRSVQRISYVEPKLNTKLRQGDKFTFTT